MSQRRPPNEQAKGNDVPFGIRAIESGIEVEGVMISRPNTPESQSRQSSAISLMPGQYQRQPSNVDLEKGVSRGNISELDKQLSMVHDRSASDSSNSTTRPQSSALDRSTSADRLLDISASGATTPSDPIVTKPAKSRHPPCSYNKYNATPHVYRHSSTVYMLEGLEAIHKASTSMNPDSGSGGSDSGNSGDDAGPISAAAPDLLSNAQPMARKRHQSADLVMLDTHRRSQAAETGQLTPKARRPGQSRDSSVASLPHSAVTPTEHSDYFSVRPKAMKTSDSDSPTNPFPSPKIDALPASVRRSSMPDVTPFAKFCQTAPPSPRPEGYRPASQEVFSGVCTLDEVPSPDFVPARPSSTPPPPAHTEPTRPSFEKRESQVVRGHGTGFEILKTGSLNPPPPPTDPLERQRAAPPISLHNTHRPRSSSAGSRNKLQKKRRPSIDSTASSDTGRKSRNSVL
jgi:hypothetical protein